MADNASKVYILVEGDHEARFTDPREAGAAFFHADRTQKPFVIQEDGDGAIGSSRFVATTQAVGEDNSEEGVRFERKVPHSHVLAEGVHPADADSMFREGYFITLEGAVKERIEAAEGPFSQELIDDIEELRGESVRSSQVGQSLPSETPGNSIELATDGDFDLDAVRARAEEQRRRDRAVFDKPPAGSRASGLPPHQEEPAAGNETAKSRQGGSNSIEELESLSGSWRDRYDVYENRKQTDFKFKGTDELAFYHTNKKVEVAAPSPQVAEDIVALASELGWSKIKVNGEDDFKHDVWKAAQKAGIKVEGYDPNKDNRVGSSKRASSQPQQPATSTADPVTSKRAEEATPSTSEAKANKPVADFARAKEAKEKQYTDKSDGPKETAASSPVENSYQGKLVSHGAASYQNNPDNSESYYAELEDSQGQISTVWGKQIQRALDECGATPGDQVELLQMGKTPVDVDVPQHNDDGEFTGFRKEQRLRNEWRANIQDTTDDRVESGTKHGPSRSTKPKA
ncbi:hypothetical protein NPJ88_000330 [Halomonas elongata]|uniref:LPD7 domain-containing protein n=1 Tax=Halomonas elongata TaxID=2746 RepID=UPI00255B39BA|nr:LPD7 domain-containing protein [Halomonas elongata]MDL4860769.1 hypothetical protein [Halomonas elongata]